MTIVELYEAVRGVPAEALPLDMADCMLRLSPRHLELVLEASMTRWLIGEGYFTFEWDSGEPDIPVATTLTVYIDPIPAKTMVEGLAAACKWAAERKRTLT